MRRLARAIKRRVAGGVRAAASGACVLLCGAPALAAPGDVVLWAWERPEDLRFLAGAPERPEVAFLAATVELGRERVTVRPRRASLLVPPGTSMTAVIRIEHPRSVVPTLSRAQRDQVVEAALRFGGRAGALQIDFDVLASERAFYRDVLRGVRRRLPAGHPLSITALAAWCWDGAWLRDLPVDEVVPLLYAMGSLTDGVSARLARGEDFTEPLCRKSLGVSIDGPSLPPLPRGRRTWIFSHSRWNEAGWTEARTRYLGANADTSGGKPPGSRARD